MTDFKPWIDFIQLVMIPGFAYGIKLLWDIREHLTRLNGRVGKCEALREAHETYDSKKHDDCQNRIETIERKLMDT